ncbi:hypothetical protein ACNPNP_00860 [Microbacterium sp. AGC85]
MTEENKGLSRRTVVKGAAWSVPVIAAAVATPLAAASVTPATIAWGPSGGQLLSVALLNGAQSGGSLANVNVLPSGANSFTITNPSAGDIVGPLTGTVAVTWTSGIPLLSPKGYGVYAVNGDTAAVSDRVETRRSIAIVIGAYETTQNIVIPQGVPGNDSLEVPITWGLTDAGDLGLSVLVGYTATLTVRDASGTQIGSTVTTPLSVPVGLDILG